MQRTIRIGVVLIAMGFPIPGYAGQFMIDRVWYTPGLESDTRINVRVGTSATYQGTLDINDHQWAIEANLIVNGQLYPASAVKGNAITPNMQIACPDTSCGGFHEFDKCPAIGYSGYGVVAIYHQFNPDIDREDLTEKTTECEELPDDPMGENESPPGDGTGCNWNYCQDESPIVIDLDRAGFRFSDLLAGVYFDLDGDGASEAISWLAADSGDGWLAIDRNGNGTIDSGTELFGNRTPQPSSAEPHGFLALAVYDRPSAGGNGDGAITRADDVFAALRVWTDGNRDGFSQRAELSTLPAVGVEEIDLDFVTSRRSDRHGNELRYASRVRLVRGTTQCADVFLLRE